MVEQTILAEQLRDLPALRACDPTPLMAPTATVAQALTLMSQRRLSAVAVAENGRLQGIFTDHDAAVRVLLRGLAAESTPLSEVMTPEPVTIHPEQTPHAALELMQVRGYRHLPVVDESGHVHGLLGVEDLYETICGDLRLQFDHCRLFVEGEPYISPPV